jgi:hypothetical protein
MSVEKASPVLRFELREAFFECVVDGRVGLAAEGDPQRGRVLFDAVDHRLAILAGSPREGSEGSTSASAESGFRAMQQHILHQSVLGTTPLISYLRRNTIIFASTRNLIP